MQSHEELLPAVLWSLVSEPAGDKRRHPRVLTNADARLLDPASGHGRVARVLEMSADGMSLVCAEAITTGRRFVLDLPRPVLCEAAHCQTEGDGFRIGAKLIDFLDNLDEEDIAVPIPDTTKVQIETIQSQTTTAPVTSLVLHHRREEMSTAVQSQSQIPASIHQWLSQGETLYSGMMKEFQTLQDKMAEMEASLQQKATEVNQIAQLLGKPAVQSNKVAAELVTHYSPELRTNDEALRIRIPGTTRPATARPARTIDAVATSVR